MAKHKPADKQRVIDLLKANVSVDMINYQTKIPLSTIRLWRDELRNRPSTAHAVLDPLPVVPIKRVLPTKSKLSNSGDLYTQEALMKAILKAANGEVIDLSVPYESTQTAEPVMGFPTTHLIVRDFNSLGSTQASSEKLGKLFQTFRSKDKIIIHFIGDHFGLGTFYKSKAADEEHAKVFLQVYQAIRNALVFASGLRLTVNIKIHGSDLRSILLDEFLHTSCRINPLTNPSSLAVLSGLDVNSGRDAIIQNELNDTDHRILYTDLTREQNGPREYCYGNKHTFVEGVIILRFGVRIDSPSFGQIIYFK